eukprot:Nk52_evm22s240 gene=Nk52_evmTU22s240
MMTSMSVDNRFCFEKAEAYVKDHMKDNDASHDWIHVQRVRDTAMKIAAKEKERYDVDLNVVEMAALLHDVGDAKYTGGVESADEMVTGFLKSINYDAVLLEKVVFIVNNMSFRKELGGKVFTPEMNIELCIVQDADRLDAIGAIGIARCFTFGGMKNRPFYDPEHPPIENITEEQYTKSKNSPTLNHFYEKLMNLKKMLKTETGKGLGEQRHDYLVGFVKQFEMEAGLRDI